MSLDGFITGPNAGPGNGLGDGGEVLHEWILGLASWRAPHGYSGGVSDGPDAEVMEEAMTGIGAGIMGRRMFDDGEGPWGQDPSIGRWGEEPPFHGPVFVLTRHPREPLELKGGTTFHFVTGSIETAVEQARDAAGSDDVAVSGGGRTISQALAAGLLDELQIHLVPVLLGAGRRLFQDLGDSLPALECVRLVESPAVTHLKYRVVK